MNSNKLAILEEHKWKAIAEEDYNKAHEIK